MKLVFHSLEYTEVRHTILERGVRADGRGPDRYPSDHQRGWRLPRTQGPLLYQRGNAEPGGRDSSTTDDEQRIDALEGEYYPAFMLHYNFPPFSVGEARPLRSRRLS